MLVLLAFELIRLGGRQILAVGAGHGVLRATTALKASQEQMRGLIGVDGIRARTGEGFGLGLVTLIWTCNQPARRA